MDWSQYGSSPSVGGSSPPAPWLDSTEYDFLTTFFTSTEVGEIMPWLLACLGINIVLYCTYRKFVNGNDETKKKLNLLKLEDQITTSVTSHTQSALNFIKSDLPPSCCTYCLFLMFMLFACSLLQDYIFPNYSFDSQGLVSAKETFLNDNEMITKILDDHMKDSKPAIMKLLTEITRDTFFQPFEMLLEPLVSESQRKSLEEFCDELNQIHYTLNSHGTLEKMQSILSSDYETHAKILTAIDNLKDIRQKSIKIVSDFKELILEIKPHLSQMERLSNQDSIMADLKPFFVDFADQFDTLRYEVSRDLTQKLKLEMNFMLDRLKLLENIHSQFSCTLMVVTLSLYVCMMGLSILSFTESASDPSQSILCLGDDHNAISRRRKQLLSINFVLLSTTFVFLLFQIVDIGSSTYKSQVSSTFKDSAKGHTTQILIPTVAFDYKFVGSSGYETSVKPEQIENLTGFKKNLDSSIRELKSLLLRHYSLVEVLTYGIKNHDYESDDNHPQRPTSVLLREILNEINVATARIDMIKYFIEFHNKYSFIITAIKVNDASQVKLEVDPHSMFKQLLRYIPTNDLASMLTTLVQTSITKSIARVEGIVEPTLKQIDSKQHFMMAVVLLCCTIANAFFLLWVSSYAYRDFKNSQQQIYSTDTYPVTQNPHLSPDQNYENNSHSQPSTNANN